MKQQISLIQNFYEEHHVKGSRLRQSFLEKQRGELFSKWIGNNKKILDLGGRDGTLTRHFSSMNEVTIGDIDSEALRFAKENYFFDTKLVNLNEKLPFKDESFDIVVMAEVLEHLPYPKIILKEINRVLRKSGKFIGNFPLAYHLKDRYQIIRGKKPIIASDPTHLQFLTYQDAKDLLELNFSIDEITILKGGNLAKKFPRLLARNIAFKCTK